VGLWCFQFLIYFCKKKSFLHLAKPSIEAGNMTNMQPKISKKPPGKKLIKRMPLRTKWLLTLAAGFVLLVYGLFVLSSAVALRITETANTLRWGLMLFYSMVIVCGAVYFFGQSIHFQTIMEVSKRTRKQERELERIARMLKKNQRRPNTPD
jgi:hypothetical protein